MHTQKEGIHTNKKREGREEIGNEVVKNPWARLVLFLEQC